MKFIALVAFVVVLKVASADPIIGASFFPQEDACISELSLDKTKIQELNENEIAPENDPDFKTFLTCYFKKMKWMELNGTLNVEKLKDAVTNAALANVDETDVPTKIMMKLMIQSSFKKCMTLFATPSFETSDATAVKVQNCLVSSLNNILDS